MRRAVVLATVTAVLAAMLMLAGVAQAQIIRIQDPSCGGLTEAAEHSGQARVEQHQEEACTFF
jgi:hypothetical protein